MAPSLVNIIVKVAFLLFSLCACLSSVSSQHCGRVTTVNKDDMCYFFVNQFNRTDVFYVSDPKQTLNGLVKQARLSAEGLKLLPRKCQQAALALTCSGTFLPCEYQTIPDTPWPGRIPLPRPPCHSVCERMVNACRPYLAESDLPDCDAIDATSGQPNFPEKFLKVTGSGFNAKIPCVDVPSKEFEDAPTDNKYACPEPMEFDAAKDPPCAIPCPVPLYTRSQYNVFGKIVGILGICSGVGATLVMIAYCLNPKLRRMPAAIVFWLSLTCIVIDVGYGLDVGSVDFICNDSTTGGDRTNGGCTIQSFSVIVGGLMNTFYFVIIGVNLFLMLAFDYVAGWPEIIITQVFCIGYPLGVWLFYVGKDWINGSILLCYVSQRWWALGLFQIPLMVCYVIVAIIAIPLTYLVLKTKIEMGKSHSKRRKWSSSVRVVAYLIWLCTVNACAMTNTIQSEIIHNDIADGITNWLLCSIALEDNCEERYKYALPFGWQAFASIYASLNGIVVFLCFGTTPEVIRWWKEILTGKFKLRDSWSFDSTIRHSTQSTHKSTADSVEKSSNSK